MSEKDPMQEILNDIYLNFSTESDSQDKSVEMLTREYLEAVLKAHLSDPTYAYRSGARLSYDDWKSSAAANSAREEEDLAIGEARREYYNERARAILGKNGKSGYGDYAAEEKKRSYERALTEGASALAESYGEFYDELESGKRGASFDTRLNAVSYIAANRMTEREGLIYALAIGLSYEEASELARSAYLLGALLDERFEDYSNGLQGSKNDN